MKRIDKSLKKGDRIWVQTYNSWGEPLRLRVAEVIAVMRISVYTKDASYAAVHFLDNNKINYECISFEQVKGFWEEGELDN